MADGYIKVDLTEGVGDQQTKRIAYQKVENDVVTAWYDEQGNDIVVAGDYDARAYDFGKVLTVVPFETPKPPERPEAPPPLKP